MNPCYHALDKSLRSLDADGHMRVELSRISKANVCSYRGSEIPEHQALGLDPEKTYRLYRDPEELAKAASTFDGKPLLIKHVPVTAELPNQKLWVGTIGACTFEPPYLITRPLTVITSEAQALIESEEQRELSAGYRYRADMTPGTSPDGEPYDGVMRDISGNHVAIVREGRAGPDVHVADESPLELSSMKHRAKIARLQKKIPALASLSTDQLMALDEELGETPAKSVVSLSEDEMKAACDAALAEKRKEHGEDAELTNEEREEALEKARDKKAKDAKAKDAKAAKDKAGKDAKDKKAADKAAADAKRARDEEEAEDAKEAAADEAEEAEDEEEEAEDAELDDEEARDRRKARDERRRARDRRAGARDARKSARDAASDPTDHRRDFRSGDSKHGKDSMTMDQVNRVIEKAVSRAQSATAEKVRAEVTAQQRALAIACDEVTPLVGKVQIHAFDSAAEVYAFALEKVGVEVEDDFPEAGLKALVKNELRHRTEAKPRAKHALDKAPNGYDPAALLQKVN